MDDEQVDYTVLLHFPGFGSERENAEAVVESAIHWLNTFKEEPGFRFAQPVSAHLEILGDSDEVSERLDSDESVALVILHEVEDEVRDSLVRKCATRRVGACVTVDAPRPHRKPGEQMRVVFRKKEDTVPAHQVCIETLTAPLGDEGDEETGQRVGELIAVVALGVMQYHLSRTK
jgi:hypothetical protein